jgi:protein required for attachment to host cells
MAEKTVWVIAADASRARVLQVASPNKLAEVASLDNPDGRMHERDLVTDAYPRNSPAGEETSPVEQATRMFVKRIGDYLEKARTARRYDELVVIAPPRILGALRKEYGKEVGKLVTQELPKDLSGLSRHELEGYFSRDGRAI